MSSRNSDVPGIKSSDRVGTKGKMRDAETKHQLEKLGREIVQHRLSEQEMPERSPGNWESINNRSEREEQGGSSNAVEVSARVVDLQEGEDQKEAESLNGILANMKRDSLSGKRQSGNGKADINVIMGDTGSKLEKLVNNDSKELGKKIKLLHGWLLNENNPTIAERNVLKIIIEELYKPAPSKLLNSLKGYIKKHYMK